MSKEKRIAEKAEKEKINAAKRAIQVAKILGNDKSPTSQKIPNPAKSPKRAPSSNGGYFCKKVEVSSEMEDRQGQWPWGVQRDWDPTPGNDHIDDFIKQYHQVKLWREVFEETAVGKRAAIKKRHIPYSISDISPAAQKRLAELELDDFEEIFRFRMTSLERLYGFLLDDGKFLTVWYDPTHQIYPMGD